MTDHPPSPIFATILDERFSRRGFLGTTGALASVAVLPGLAGAATSEHATPSSFVPIPAQKTDAVVLPKGYTYDLVARWGDSMFPGTPSLTGDDVRSDALLRDGAAQRQERQFGTNCDAVAFFPLSGKRSDRGILCVNSEYVLPDLMFRKPRNPATGRSAARKAWILENPQVVDVMKAAHGVNVLEVTRRRGAWSFTPGTRLTRRITAETVCEIMGPARGAPLMRTNADPTGTRVRGTMANCSAGKTPWGTYLTSEENIDDYFGNATSWADVTDDKATVDAHRRFPLSENSAYGWDHVDPRFNVLAEPREALRFGWMVEIDPRDPTSVPKKRTSLGRFSHESAAFRITRDGRVAVYLGDDDMFEYVYKFVTRDKFDPRNPAANRDLLDHGILHAARFDSSGKGEWVPLVYDEKGPLNSSAGFTSQADVVIKARAAADIMGATPMDRPEDIEASPFDGHVYIACTKNANREAGSRTTFWGGRMIDVGVNAANPRPENTTGHIIELKDDAEDAASTSFAWNVFLLAGNPAAPGSQFMTRYEDVGQLPVASASAYHAGAAGGAASCPMACPDNLGIDASGRLWIVTDSSEAIGANDGCYVCPTTGPERGMLKQLMSAPVGAEVCGCEFTPDSTTLFLAIQHPGEGGTVDEPLSHWPDGNGLPARSALIAVRREDGKPV